VAVSRRVASFQAGQGAEIHLSGPGPDRAAPEPCVGMRDAPIQGRRDHVAPTPLILRCNASIRSQWPFGAQNQYAKAVFDLPSLGVSSGKGVAT
jgi:hypothetical protein